LKQTIESKNLANIPARFSIAMQDIGFILRNKIIWHKPSVMPSSAKDRFTVDFEEIFFFTKNQRYYFEQQLEKFSESSLSRVKYGISKSNKIMSNNYSMHYENVINCFKKMQNGEIKGRNKRCVWTIATKPFHGAHFAVFPPDLVEIPIKAGCPNNGMVLDPFIGSGTTAVVAKKLGRNYIGIELNPKYIEIANKRINETKAVDDLFAFSQNG